MTDPRNPHDWLIHVPGMEYAFALTQTKRTFRYVLAEESSGPLIFTKRDRDRKKRRRQLAKQSRKRNRRK